MKPPGKHTQHKVSEGGCDDPYCECIILYCTCGQSFMDGSDWFDSKVDQVSMWVEWADHAIEAGDSAKWIRWQIPKVLRDWVMLRVGRATSE